MDKNTGTLTAEDKKKFLDWLNSKTKNNPTCPVCSENDWSVADHLINAMAFTPNAMIIGGPTYPMAVLACNNCAFTRTFMAVPVGLVPPPETKGGGNGK